MPPKLINRAIIRTGWIIAAIGVALMAANFAVDHGQPEPTARPRELVDVDELAPLPNTPASDPEAVRLTQQARRAGLAGACAAVRQLGPRVRAADAIYYRGVIVVDPPIAACL